MTETILDNFGRPFDLPGVYSDFTHKCRLVYVQPDGTRSSLDLDDEPIGWSGLKFKLERGSLHGVNYEYTSSDTALEFDGDSGLDMIQAIFLAEGEDATILFQYILDIPAITDPVSGIGVPGFEVVEYEGRINLSTRKTVKRRISASLERTTLQSRVTAKQGTNLNLGASRSLDGAQIVPPSFSTIPLTGQSVEERFTCNVTAGGRTEQAFQGDTNGHVWIQFDTSQPQIDEIEELAGGRPLGLSESEGPIENDEWLFKFRSTGVRRAVIELGYKTEWSIKKRTISVGAAYVTGYQLLSKLVHVRGGLVVQEWDITTQLAEGLARRPPYSGFRENDLVAIATGKIDVQIDARAGDKLFLFGKLSFTHNKNELQQTRVAVSVVTQRISVSGKSKNNATSVRCLPIGKALNQALTIITGLSDRLRSAFYSLQDDRYPTNGCGAKRVVFNGFAARQFKSTERPISFSFEDAVNSLAAIDCIGLQYTHELDDDGNPVEIVKIEPVQTFYRPVELLRLDEVGDYREETITGEIYSNLEIGYQDYLTEGSGVLEEVHTLHQITTPIKHESAKKVISSPFIASSLAIEKTRREQFNDTPSDSTTYDEKTFIVQCKPTEPVSRPAVITDTLVGAVIALDEPIDWLLKGDTITITGTASADGVFTVAFVSDLALRPWTFIVNEHINPQTVGGLIIEPVDGLNFVPETGTDFESVSGLSSPDDTLNLRLTPGRMLFNTAPVWAGCLINKDKYNLINKKQIVETGLMTIRFTRIFGVNMVIVGVYQDWITAGMTVKIEGDTANTGLFTVIAVSDPVAQPWSFLVKEELTPDFGTVNISFETISTDDLYAAVNKTKIPSNKKVSTTLEPGDDCGRPGRVTEAEPILVDELIASLLYLPRLIKFKARLSASQIQRLRLGHTGLLPIETDDLGEPIDRNYGYISLLNESGIRVAGYLENVEYSRDDEAAIFELRQTALDLNDTFSGLDCTQFAGISIAQAMNLSERYRRRIELCRISDVDPL